MPYNDPNKTVYIEEDTSALDKELAREKHWNEAPALMPTSSFNRYEPASQPPIYQGVQPWRCEAPRP